jgi:hypothetical protein
VSRSSQRWGSASCLAACLSAVATMRAFGSDTASFEALLPVPLPAHRLVLRVSDAVLASYLGREIEQQVPVQDIILGTTVTGTAQISGQPCVKLLERTEGAAFHVEVRGTAVSRTIGRNGPAIIHSRSVTHFTATKQIVYKAGQGFSASPGQVFARTQCFTEGIGSTRGRLIGRIVRRRAAEQIAENKALTTEIARQKAQRQIAAAFERRMDERIAHLNQMVESQSLWASLVGGSGRMPYACCSTQDHLQIAAAHARESRPIALPVRGPASSIAAPLELWVHNSLLPGPTPGLLNRLAQTSAASDVLNACLSPTALIKKQSLEAAIVGLTRNLDCQTIGDWVVVEVRSADQQELVRTAAGPAALR